MSLNFGENLSQFKADKDFFKTIVDESSKRKNKIPSLFIENRLVRGDVNPQTALSAICDVTPLNVRPSECGEIEGLLFEQTNRLMSSYSHEGSISTSRRLLYMILTSIVLFGLTYLIGSYLLQKRLEKDIVKDIDSSLERYYQIQNTSIEIVPRDGELTADHS